MTNEQTPQRRSLRLRRAVRSDLPLPPFRFAPAGIYPPEKIQTNRHGAVSVLTDGGWLGIKPDEMEWMED